MALSPCVKEEMVPTGHISRLSEEEAKFKYYNKKERKQIKCFKSQEV